MFLLHRDGRSNGCQSHGSQDLYPQMLENQFGFSKNAGTVTQVVANLGAMTGGTVIGYCKPPFSPLSTESRANLFRSIANLWPPFLYHRHVHRRRGPIVPLWLYREQTHNCRRLLRTVLCSRRMGRYSDPSHGTLPGIFQDIRCWDFLPTW